MSKEVKEEIKAMGGSPFRQVLPLLLVQFCQAVQVRSRSGSRVSPNVVVLGVCSRRRFILTRISLSLARTPIRQSFRS